MSAKTVSSLHQGIAKDAEKKTVWGDLMEPITLCAQANAGALGLAKTLIPVLKASPTLNATYNGVVGGLVEATKTANTTCTAANNIVTSHGAATEVAANDYPEFLEQSAILGTQVEQLQVQVEACLPIVEAGV